MLDELLDETWSIVIDGMKHKHTYAQVLFDVRRYCDKRELVAPWRALTVARAAAIMMEVDYDPS